MYYDVILDLTASHSVPYCLTWPAAHMFFALCDDVIYVITNLRGELEENQELRKPPDSSGVCVCSATNLQLWKYAYHSRLYQQLAREK